MSECPKCGASLSFTDPRDHYCGPGLTMAAANREVARLRSENAELQAVIIQVRDIIDTQAHIGPKFGYKTVAELTGFDMLPMLNEALATRKPASDEIGE